MDSSDVVDDVNALIKLGVGDPYRLEHIKQAYVQNKTVWETDKKYLERMKEKYLTKLAPESQQSNENSNVDFENIDKEFIHCWKCGNKNPIKGNFCMNCGSPLFDVGEKHRTISQPIQNDSTKNPSKKIGIKIPILIGIPVLVLAVIGVGISQGLFDNVLDDSSNVLDDNDNMVEPVAVSDKTQTAAETNSKCGKGTVFDPDTNSCILDK